MPPAGHMYADPVNASCTLLLCALSCLKAVLMHVMSQSICRERHVQQQLARYELDQHK